MNAIHRLLPALALVTALGASLLVEAASADSSADAAQWHQPSQHARHARSPLRSVLAQLDLTADQKAQIQTIYQQARPQFQTLMSALRNERQVLAGTAPSDPGYAAALSGAKANADARVQLESDLHTQVFAVLTPAQQAQIPQLLAAELSAREARRANWKSQHDTTQP